MPTSADGYEPELNRFLASLPRADYQQLLPDLKAVQIEHKQYLSRVDEAIALAAMCPPLSPQDVVHAADQLMSHTDRSLVIAGLLQLGSTLLAAKRVVEALEGLRATAG